MSSPVIAESISLQEEHLETLMQRRLGNRIRDLRVQIRPKGVVLQGRVATYHAKQLAQQQILPAPLFTRTDMRKDQPGQVVRAIPPGGGEVAGQAFAPVAREGDRVTLPFIRLADDTDPSKAAKGTAGGTVRRDGASFPRPHLARLGARKADR